jgi:hypothetical protein
MAINFSMLRSKDVVGALPAAGVAVLTIALAQAQSVVYPSPNDTVIMVNGHAKSGTISDPQGQMSFVVSGTGTHVLSVDGRRVPLGSPQEKAAIVRVNAALAAFAKNGPSGDPAAQTNSVASGPAVPSAETPAKASVEFGTGGHVTVHRATATVDLGGKTSTVTFNNTPIPFEIEYRRDGVAGGLMRSASRSGRSFATEGFGFKMAGREMYDSRNGGAVPGGNDGIVMKAARELLAAMDDAEAQAAKNGQSYAPAGKKALQDMVAAHSGTAGFGINDK